MWGFWGSTLIETVSCAAQIFILREGRKTIPKGSWKYVCFPSIPIFSVKQSSVSPFSHCLIVYFGRYSAVCRLLNLCCGNRGTRLFVFRTGVDFEKYASAGVVLVNAKQAPLHRSPIKTSPIKIQRQLKVSKMLQKSYVVFLWKTSCVYLIKKFSDNGQ